MKDMKLASSLLAVALAAAAGSRCQAFRLDFDGRSAAAAPVLDIRPVSGGAAPAADAGPGAPGRVLRLVNGFPGLNEQFRKLEEDGYELKVLNCAFARMSPHVIIVAATKLPAGRSPSVRTEYQFGGRYVQRLNELGSQGRAAETVCYVNFPGWLGDHAVIQYR